MKTKRLLSTVLAVVMLVSVFSVVAFAGVGPYTFALTNTATKTEYFDYERFDPTGITVEIKDSTDAVVETVSYSDSTSNRFTFKPTAAGQVLSVDVTAIEVILDGQSVASIPLTVNHKYEDNVSLGNTKHGTKCAGCGDVVPDSMAEHTYDDDAWVPNDDATFLRDETESNFCLICAHEIKRDISSSADYDYEFREYQFLRDLMSYIEILLDLIYGSIRR